MHQQSSAECQPPTACRQRIHATNVAAVLLGAERTGKGVSARKVRATIEQSG
jgi:hypothetical protein